MISIKHLKLHAEMDELVNYKCVKLFIIFCIPASMYVVRYIE